MNSKIKNANKNKSYALVKNAVNLKSFGLDFDFNSMYEFFNIYPKLKFEHKGSPFIGQVHDIINNQTSMFFNGYLTFLHNLLENTFNHTDPNNIFRIGKLDFIFSTQGYRGGSHIDPEHVIILGVYKNTYYHIQGEDVKVCPGDLLYIYKNVVHHAFSSTERIVFSISVWDNDQIDLS